MHNTLGEGSRNRYIPEVLQSWIMTMVALLFLFLYITVIVGWIKPSADEKTLNHLEPIIFVVVGYYFGRMPSQHNETLLKEEIKRQTQRAEAAQSIKEKAEQAREVLEEKIKTTKTILVSSSANLKSFELGLNKTKEGLAENNLYQSIAIVLNVLSS